MNPPIFSFWGYLSVLVWLAVPVLWVLHAVRRPRRWFCHYAVLMAVVALGFAKINSLTYVNRIQIDRSEEIAAAQAAQEARRKAAEEARAGEVAQVRFAEDDATDYLDQAGMEEADLKYMASFDEEATPEWKKEKKSRSQTPASDDSLEGLLDPTAEKEEGVATDVIEEQAEKEPIMMPEKRYMLANALDKMNLRLVRLLMLVGLAVVVLDYLSRINSYPEAYLPLPLPSRLAAGMGPLPVVRRLPETPRRPIAEELAWLARRGDAFVYITDNASAASSLPDLLWRVPRPHLGRVDLIHVDDANPVPRDFVFETLWYGRSSFVVDSAARGTALMARMLELLELRKASRAKVRQSVHVVWDVSSPLSPETVAAFERLGQATGFTLAMRAG